MLVPSVNGRGCGSTRGFGEWLQCLFGQGDGGDKAVAGIGSIQRAAQTLARLVDDYLDRGIVVRCIANMAQNVVVVLFGGCRRVGDLVVIVGVGERAVGHVDIHIADCRCKEDEGSEPGAEALVMAVKGPNERRSEGFARAVKGAGYGKTRW